MDWMRSLALSAAFCALLKALRDTEKDGAVNPRRHCGESGQ